MRKNVDYFRSNRLIYRFVLAMMVLAMNAAVVQAGAVDKREAKVGDKSGAKTTIMLAEQDQKMLCRKVATLLKENKIDKYVPERKDFDPRGSEYLNVDIDGDGKADKIIVSTGAGESYLKVYLPTGIEYDLEVSGFITLIRFEGNIYAIVTYREWNAARDDDKIIGYRLYKLTKDKANIVCDKL
jgi:hypothetical protein